MRNFRSLVPLMAFFMALSVLVAAAPQAGGGGATSGGGAATTGTTGGGTTGSTSTGGATGGATGSTTGGTQSTTGGTTGTTGGATTGGTTAPPKTGAEAPAAKDPVLKDEKPVEEKLPIFGLDQFAMSRAQITAMRANAGKVTTPLNNTNQSGGTNQAGGAAQGGGTNQANAANPATQMSPVLIPGPASPPENYQLNSGDKLTIRIWSPTSEAKELKSVIDVNGRVKGIGEMKPIVVRGMTLAQAENRVRQEARQYIRDANVSLELDELRSFSVTLIGEAFTPGTYTVPATTSLFNLLYFTGGPTDKGSLRQIKVQRGNGKVVTVDLYDLFVNANPKQDLKLQPGDIVSIPPFKSRVSLKGEVGTPAIYEIFPGEGLAKLLRFSGGIRPSGVAQNVAIESLVPGMERRLVNADLNKLSGMNQELYNGDVVEVYSLRPDFANRVRIEGPVDQPRDYALSAGMTVRDLIQASRGLLAEAYLPEADLFRENADRSLSVIKIDLTRVLNNDPTANIPLRPNDVLKIRSQKDMQWFESRKVIVSGAVREPGEFPRTEGMRLFDALLAAKGLLPNAGLKQAFIQRINPDGTNGPIVTVNLSQAIALDESQNVLLQDRDRIRILTAQETAPISDQSVEVLGAVQRPDTYPLASNMRLLDLLRQAGMPKLDAYLDRAFLYRFDPNGLTGPMKIVNLRALMEGDESQNIPLQSRDRLIVKTIKEAEFTADRKVNIFGAVQAPGEYVRAEGMKLADLLALAGGLRPDAGTFVEIAKARQPLGGDATRIQLNDVSKLSAYMLEDGDLITVPGDSSILLTPIYVEIRGKVKNPGFYPLTRVGETLNDLIKKAGGLNKEAWVKGAQFARDPKFLRTELQQRVVPRVQEVYRDIQTAEYQRALVKTEIEKIREINKAGKGGDSSLPISIPGLGGASTAPAAAAPTDAEKAAQASLSKKVIDAQLVTPARERGQFEGVFGGNLQINLESALKNRGSLHDIALKEGDIITIPESPATVMMDGPGLILPQGVLYQPGKNLGWYIQQAGGFTVDAAKDLVVVIRPSGSITKAKASTKIEIGDVVFVPTRVMVAKLGSGENAFESIVKSITNGAILYGIFKALL